MKIVEDRDEARTFLRDRREMGETVGFVPTMGALHEGHLSLIQRARESCDRVAVSIFVNPTQFGPKEDFTRYPRDLPGDTEKCRRAGADLLFFPRTDALYPEGYRTYVTVEDLSDRLCGASRPGHFRGVATVVLKLLQIVRPDRLFLGEKDYQQCVIIRRMVRDFDLEAEVVICPTVREPDGLAMSSRNAYLDPEDRKGAAALHRALTEARKIFLRGERNGEALRGVLTGVLSAEPRIRPDYIRIVHPETLKDVKEAETGSVMALAVWIGATRLIDNMTLGSS
ncbi:MAG: pantoate--beta-alanine ligase [Nitrospirae bacterium]|nr:pantoate--beta-alanine ligase [Nitrospirota bacterium]